MIPAKPPPGNGTKPSCYNEVMAENRIVYSTDGGRIPCRACGRPAHGGPCGSAALERAAKERGKAAPPKGDGIVRVSRDRKQRRGKVVTVVTGVPLPEVELTELAGRLKRQCGTGGTVKDGAIEIQGDHRDRLADLLRDLGYQVKLAGG
jgi:translation initiation factor 1